MRGMELRARQNANVAARTWAPRQPPEAVSWQAEILQPRRGLPPDQSTDTVLLITDPAPAGLLPTDAPSRSRTSPRRRGYRPEVKCARATRPTRQTKGAGRTMPHGRSNHLGNVLATVSDLTVATPAPEEVDLPALRAARVETSTDRYPFGAAIAGRTYARGIGLSSSTYGDVVRKYRYGFNGKEDDISWGGEDALVQDYGFRVCLKNRSC